MIRAYSIIGKDLHVTDIVSQDVLLGLGDKADWLWMDCFDLDDNENMIISGLLGVEKEVLGEIIRGKMQPCYENCRDYVWISIPSVDLAKGLRLHPMSIIIKGNHHITLRNKHHSGFIESIVKTLGDCTAEGEKVDPSYIVSRIVHEIVDENSRAMVSLRELIDKIEEEALEKPWKKAVTHSVFRVKKWMSKLHRLLWVEKELVSDMKESMIPHVRLTKETKVIVDDAMDDVNRELEFVDSYNRSLDGILRLQDLGLIHRVERNLVYLTLIILLMNVLLIILSLMAK